MNQLKEYIIALTNLYGAVHKEKVMEIYNSQNKDRVSLKEIEVMLKNPPVDLEAFAVYTEGEYFIHEAIFMIDNLEDMLRKKKGKPHYVPHKNELLKYMDEEHFEKTGEYKALVKYVKKNFLKNQPERAEELCEEIHKILHVGPDMQEVMNTLNYWGIDFKDMDQLNELTALLMKFANNIRIWENNGHTPEEISRKFEKPNMKPLPKKPFDFKKTGNGEGDNGDEAVGTKKVGRNEPCPCGSGKKYKKCCGKNENVISLFGDEITPEEALEVRRLFFIYSEPKIAKVIGKMHDQFGTGPLSLAYQKDAEFLFIEWLVMEYPYEGDQSLFDLFLEDMKGKMDRRLLQKLESWKKSYLSVYEVIDDREERVILVKDIFTYEEKVVGLDEGDPSSKVGDMQVTRLVPVAGVYEYFFGAFYLPLKLRDLFVHLLKMDKKKYNKTWEALLKENGDRLVQLIADMFKNDQKKDQKKEHLKSDNKLKGINDYLEIPAFTPKEIEEVESILRLDWKKDIYREEARLFIEKSQGIYLPIDIISGLYMWWDYTEFEAPGFRKQGVWAAALNELIDELYNYYHYDSRSEIADTYGVSASSVGTYYYRLWDFVELHHAGIKALRKKTPLDKASKKKIGPAIEGIIKSLKELSESKKKDAKNKGLEDDSQMDLEYDPGMDLEDDSHKELKNSSRVGLEDNPISATTVSKNAKAQDLIYDAWESRSPTEIIHLAKRALEIDPRCADAYVLLAEHRAKNVEEAITYYQKGIQAGEKALGKTFFKENQGHFWGILETRPYMRAKMGLGMSLLEKKEYSHGAEVLEEMLKLNPNDNQGVRSPLVIAYFMEKDYSKAKALLDRYDEDFLSDWSYNKALQVFCDEGETQEAKRRLKNAIKKNPHVPKYLLGEKRLPDTPPEAYSLGGEEEAIIYAIYGKKAWLKTPGAVAWLHKNIKK